ncbi:MAG: VOC family protein, partial [Reichenbachiella sp.]
MRNKHISVLLTFLVAILLFQSKSYAQHSINELRFTSATLVVKDLKASAAWYRKFLKFKIEEYKPNQKVKMRNDEFVITLQQGNSTLLKSQIQFKEGKKYINGIDKIGFDTNRFDSLYMYFERYEQPITLDSTEQKNIAKRTFIVKDPDGNNVQFFDGTIKSEQFAISPSFFSIQSSDYINTMKWYKEEMGFQEIKMLDNTHLHYQNL